MVSTELVLAMLLAVVVSGFVVRVLPFSLPIPIVQIALGYAIAGILHHGVVLQPSVFFLLFLPPLLFLAGWTIPKDGLLRDKWAVLQLALGLVVFTVLTAGYLIHWLIPIMPLAVAFALAAIVSPTDPVAISTIAARTPVPKRLMHLLEGESLLNDASGLVCFEFAVAAAMTGRFSLGSAALTLLWVALVGVACGVAFTVAIAAAQQWLSRQFGEEGGSPILISLLIPFGAYLLSEALHASGILAAVAAGITMSYVERTVTSMATTRLQRRAVWSTIQFALNGIVFVVLGEQLPGIVRRAVASMYTGGGHGPWWLGMYAVGVTAGLALLRLLWVWVSLRANLYRRRRTDAAAKKVSWRLVLATSLAGVRGAITLAGILTLPLLMPDGSPFPARDLAVFLAAAVIVLSLIGASVSLPPLLRGLDVPQEPAAEQEEDRARAAAARAAIESIKTAQGSLLESAGLADIEVYANAASRVIAIYQPHIHERTREETEARRLRKADAAERALRLAALRGERAEIINLLRHHEISDETSRKLVHEIDLLESRYR
jgi:CPA1 family monovalent cation:H+ antiporter